MSNIKAWSNARNISTQHLATLLDTTSCMCLATLLRNVATCWMMLDQIRKRSNFACNILDVARCCTCLATFTQHSCTRACAVGPLCCAPGARAHKHRHVALRMLKILWAFGQIFQGSQTYFSRVSKEVKCYFR